MVTQAQKDESVTDFINLGIASALSGANWLQQRALNSAKSELLANLTADEAVIAQWLKNNEAKYGWKYLDPTGSEVFVANDQPVSGYRSTPIPASTVLQLGTSLFSAMRTAAAADGLLGDPIEIQELDNLTVFFNRLLPQITASFNAASETK